MVVQLLSEQFVWLMTLSVSERRKLSRALATQLWKLEWNAETHEFELKQL